MKCIIPIAGIGSRFYPYTDNIIPKELLIVYNRPVIDYIFHSLLDLNLDIYLITRDKQFLEEYCSSWTDRLNIQIINQIDGYGLAVVLQSVKNYLNNNEQFIFLLPDEIIYNGKALIRSLIDLSYMYTNSTIIAVEKVSIDDISKYGCVVFNTKVSNNLYTISSFIEKPIKPLYDGIHYGCIGRYLIHTDIFNYIESNIEEKEMNITDPILSLSKDNIVYAYLCSNNYIRFDMGNPDSYIDSLYKMKQNNYFINE